MQYEVDVNGRTRQIHVQRQDGRFTVTLDGVPWLVDAARVDANTWSLLLEASGDAAAPAGSFAGQVTSFEVTLTLDPATKATSAAVGPVPLVVSLNGRRGPGRTREQATSRSSTQRLIAPMPGKVLRLLVVAGQTVEARQPVAVVEAMKMENEIRAVAPGVVESLHVREGQSVDAGSLLVVLEPV